MLRNINCVSSCNVTIISYSAEKCKYNLSNGVMKGVNGSSEAHFLIVFGDEAVIGYMASSVHTGFCGETVAVAVGDIVGKVNEIIEFFTGALFYYHAARVASEYSKGIL